MPAGLWFRRHRGALTLRKEGIRAAYMGDREHIRALVEFAMSLNPPHQNGLRVWWNRNWLGFDYGDQDHAAQLGAELWTENRRSVETRYPDCRGTDDLPGKIGEDWVYGAHLPPQRDRSPVEILAACAGFDYQACESDDWADTKAHAILHAIKEKAIRMLPGYDQAEWTIGDPTRDEVPKPAAVGGHQDPEGNTLPAGQCWGDRGAEACTVPMCEACVDAGCAVSIFNPLPAQAR